MNKLTHCHYNTSFIFQFCSSPNGLDTLFKSGRISVLSSLSQTQFGSLALNHSGADQYIYSCLNSPDIGISIIFLICFIINCCSLLEKLRNGLILIGKITKTFISVEEFLKKIQTTGAQTQLLFQNYPHMLEFQTVSFFLSFSLPFFLSLYYYFF